MVPKEIALNVLMTAVSAAVGKLTESLIGIIGKDKKENSQNHNDESNQNDESNHNDESNQNNKYKVDLEVVKKLKLGIGGICDVYEEHIEKVIEEWDSISEDEIIAFFSEENKELEKILNVLYEYEGSVARILPNQIEEYKARRDDLRKIQESITKFINKGESLDLCTTLNQYQGDINALYSVFKEIVDADAINI